VARRRTGFVRRTSGAAPTGTRSAVTRVLVTGAASFTALHLRPLLARDAKVTVIATDRAGAPGGGAELQRLDLRDEDAVRALVAQARPDLVFHLAGVAGRDDALCWSVNLGGTRHLLDACAALRAETRVVLVSSAAVYGLTRPEENPVREDTPLRPVTAYGASKAAAELAGLSMHRRGSLHVKVARTFNLIGPGLGLGFAPSDFMARAAQWRGRPGPHEIAVGALEPSRDFVDVRDAARAYVLLGRGEDGWGEAYNVATGRPVRIRDLFDAVAVACGVQARPVEDPARRRIEVLEQVGDAGRLRALTGWRPEVPLEASLADMAAAGS
jgi:GDP-4-dehydro-6-deoxy-D-mannose reductase